MDTSSEKFWFIYFGDHHEGPFSISEIKAKFSNLSITAQHYAWKEGMADWKQIQDLPDLSIVMEAPPLPSSNNWKPEAATAKQSIGDVTRISPISDDGISPSANHSSTGNVSISQDLNQAELKPTSINASQNTNLADLDSTTDEKVPLSKKKTFSKGGLFIIFLTLAGGLGTFAFLEGKLDPLVQSNAFKQIFSVAKDLAQPYLLDLSESYPVLQKWVSPLPPITEVTAEDYEKLKAAALPRVDKHGPKVALAVSQEDSTKPSFFLATNLPDGATLDIQIVGKEDRLLNSHGFRTTTQATVVRKIAKTPRLEAVAGRPIPKGDYSIFVSEAKSQPTLVNQILEKLPATSEKTNKKISESFDVFLGGKKDATFETRLGEYHDTVRKQVQREWQDLKMLSGMLDSQFQATDDLFAKLKAQLIATSKVKGKSAQNPVRKGWSEFHQKFVDMQKQASKSFESITVDSAQTDYFFGKIFSDMQMVDKAIIRYHEIQTTYFDSKVDPKIFEIQLGESRGTAMNLLAQLKLSIDRIEKGPRTKFGLPKIDESKSDETKEN